MPSKRQTAKPELVGFLGVGLDNQDDHRRLTRSQHFFLVGGSAETHEQMQDTALRFEEALKQRGQQLEDADPAEVLEWLREALDS